MTNLLDLVDKLIGDVLQGNLYTDSATFRQSILHVQTPRGAHRHIPNADPRLLDLRPPLGFDHPHDAIAKEPGRRVMPSQPMHDTQDKFVNENGVIPGPKRTQIYQGSPPSPTPQSVSRQVTNLESGVHPSPGQPVLTDFTNDQGQILGSTRRAVYDSGGPVPQSVSQQTANLGASIAPPPTRPLNVPFTTDSGEILRDKSTPFYDNPLVAPLGSLNDLASFHERKTRPPTTDFVERSRFEDDNFPPKTPADNAPPNDFVGIESRPLNFRDGEEYVGGKREKLAAGFHEQKIGDNSKLDYFPEPHGLTENNLYNDSDDFSTFQGPFTGPVPQPLNYANIFASANWLRNIATELGAPLPDGTTGIASGRPETERIVKGVTFLTTQLLLTSFNVANPENGIGNAIYNPLSLMAAVPFVAGAPFVGAVTNFTAGAVFGNYQDGIAEAEALGVSRLQLARDGLYAELSPIHRVSKGYSPIPSPGFLGEMGGPGSGDTLDKQQRGQPSLIVSTIEEQVDGGKASETIIKQGIHTNLYTKDRPYGQQTAIYPLEQLTEISKAGVDPASDKLANVFDFINGGGNDIFVSFDPSADKAPPSAQFGGWMAKSQLGKDTGFSETSLVDAPGINAAVVDAAVPFEDEETGYVIERPLSGDDIYLDLMFRDLRDESSNFLYFRAFLKGDINETFTPDWQSQHFYGRVDQVPIYKGTLRTLNFTFDVAAFKPLDLDIIWRKLGILQSMVYPTFDTGGFMSQGPLIRLKIGDLFAGENNLGLPGYIAGMDWSFPDGIWNIEKDYKVPRLVTVAISFTVIHDGNPGIYPLKQWDVKEDGSVENEAGSRTFGTARLSSQPGGVTRFNISSAEIRKIFAQVKNK